MQGIVATRSASSRGGASTGLFSLLYRSQATPPQSEAALSALVRDSQRRNRAAGVTGVLVAGGERYLQCLEGPEPAVRGLMAAIQRDPRHDRIEAMEVVPLPRRRFGGWDMRLVHTGHARMPDFGAAPSQAACLADWLGDRAVAARDLADRSALLERLVVHTVLPELHRRLLPATGCIEGLAEAAAAVAEAAMAGGGSDAILRPLADPKRDGAWRLAVLEAAARRIGDRTDDSSLGALAASAALAGLLPALRLLGSAGHAMRRPPADPRRVLVAPLPGESDLLGAAIAQEWLWQQGWEPILAGSGDDEALARRIAELRPAAVVVALSPAFRRRRALLGLEPRLLRYRAASAGDRPAILLTGRSVAERLARGPVLARPAMAVLSADLDPALRRVLAAGRPAGG